MIKEGSWRSVDWIPKSGQFRFFPILLLVPVIPRTWPCFQDSGAGTDAGCRHYAIGRLPSPYQCLRFYMSKSISIESLLHWDGFFLGKYLVLPPIPPPTSTRPLLGHHTSSTYLAIADSPLTTSPTLKKNFGFHMRKLFLYPHYQCDKNLQTCRNLTSGK